MAQPSAHSMRALRTAVLARPSPAPVLSQCASQHSQHRLFSSSRAAYAPQSLAAQRIRSQPCCHHERVVLQRNFARGRRSFHFSALAQATVNTVEAGISQLHAVTHTPWYITIPLVALGVNLVVRLPFSVQARKLAVSRSRLEPVLRAWYAVHSKTVRMEQRTAATNGTAASLAVPVRVEAEKRLLKTASRLYAALGLQQWRLYGNVLSLPPWLVVIEAVRQMCGAPTGLLGMVFRRGGAAEATGATAAEAEATAAAAASAPPEVVDIASVASAAQPSTGSETVTALADPSFTTGGCLWFPDLTVADPYHILPFALSAMLVVNILPSTDSARRALFGLQERAGDAVSTQSIAARALSRTLLLMSIFVGPLTLHFPAAIHIYWLSSAAVTYLINRSVKLMWPVPKTTMFPKTGTGTPIIIPQAPAPKDTGKK